MLPAANAPSPAAAPPTPGASAPGPPSRPAAGSLPVLTSRRLQTAERGVLIFLVAAMVALVLGHRYLPMNDAPSHTANAVIVSGLWHGDPFFAEHYQLQSAPLPYWAVALSMFLLQLVLPPLLAQSVDLGFRTLPAQRLSELGVYVGPPAALMPAPGFIQYDVAVPLYSDEATKHRLLRLLLRHPNVELVAVTSRSLAGKALSKEFPRFRSVGVADSLTFTAPDAAALKAAGAEIVTVAIRRTNLGQDSNAPNLLDVLPPEKYTLLPNTAGCYNVEDAVRTCQLARELLDGHRLVKLEVLGDPKTLFPNVIETIKAAEILVRDGFDVMVYTSDDPIIAKQLEAIGCVAVMPLAAPIGSGLGIQNPVNIRIIIEQCKVPVLVDAGVGTASDAAIAMELGCDGVLMNTAIASAKNPVLMASAMRKAVEAGREAFLAGRIPKKRNANASSPIDGLFF